MCGCSRSCTCRVRGMKKFVIIVNALKDQYLAETKKICSYIEKRGAQCQYLVSVDEQEGIQKVYAESIPKGTECILVLGGDGTLIRAARDTVECGIPLIGVNLGMLGYLCELEKNSVYDAIDSIMKDEYMLEERMMLTGEKCGEAVPLQDIKQTGQKCGESIREEHRRYIDEKYGESMLEDRRPLIDEKCGSSIETAGSLKNKKGSYRALNDIVIHRTGELSLVSLNVYVNGQYLNTFKGDGMILSTPTGSTGYNMSAGGPIVDPKAQLLLLTPINTHTLMPRSIVIDSQDEIVVEVGHRRSQRDETVEVSFDGDHGCWLKVGECIYIRKAQERAKILKISKMSFLEILRKKMQTFS